MTHPLPVFLDRDGVINRDSADYIRSLKDWVPLPGSIEAIANLSNAGHPVIIVTNQSAISRKYCLESDVMEIHQHLIQLVDNAGGKIDGIYYCPHHPDDECDCRKPKTGMLDKARQELNLPHGGYLVGDASSDMEMGRRAELKTILVLTGRGLNQLELIEMEDHPMPWRVTEDLASAASIILEDSTG
ncbi:MAG: D-glycero-beta-D-manno-heptose 1,7-bisphosphate 7-phosphatase [Candidatus Aegiribacteria sp.]|nr:D-glycero-beta-D-manno-heptose 1,7-bisphosphate 7-phosphatase [Candidatus Aegiribacteria sp.]